MLQMMHNIAAMKKLVKKGIIDFMLNMKMVSAFSFYSNSQHWIGAHNLMNLSCPINQTNHELCPTRSEDKNISPDFLII